MAPTRDSRAQAKAPKIGPLQEARPRTTFLRTTKPAFEETTKVTHKENIKPALKQTVRPAEKRKHVSTAALFKSSSTRIHKPRFEKLSPIPVAKDFHQGYTTSKTKGLGKSILSRRHRFLSPPPKPQKPVHPLVADLRTSISIFREGAPATAESYIQPAHDALLDRLANGPPASPSNTTLPLRSHIAEVVELDTRLRAPLADEKVKVRFRHPDGRVTPGEVALGHTVTRFSKLLKVKQLELQSLKAEQASVLRQIAELGAELLDDPSFPAQFGYPVKQDRCEQRVKRSFPAQEELELITADFDEERARYEAEIEKACAEEKDAKKRKVIRWFEILKTRL